MDEWRKRRRQSAKAIPVCAALFAFAVMLALLLRPPWWIAGLLIALTGFTLVGDVVNYYYCGRRIRGGSKHD